MGQDLVHPYIQSTTVLCDTYMNETVDFVTRCVRNLTIRPDDDRVGIKIFGTKNTTQTLINFFDSTKNCKCTSGKSFLHNEW